MELKKFALATLAFVISGFAIAAIWHFVIFAQTYQYLKMYTQEPGIALGFTSFILEGLAFVYIFQHFRRGKEPVREGLVYGLLIYGVLMGGVGVLAEGAKYSSTSLTTWILVEGAFYLVAGAVTGTLVSLIYARK
jgi:uncharacterized membrane protein